MILPSSIYAQVAEELNLPIGLVKKVNSYYWKEGIRKNLANVSHNSIFIKNFGSIVTSKFKLNSEILLIIKKIRRVQNSNKYKESSKILIIENYKTKLRKLLKMRNKIIKDNYFKNGLTY